MQSTQNRVENKYKSKLIHPKINVIISDNIPKELLPTRSISHHMDTVPAVSLPNKVLHTMTPEKNEGFNRKIQEMLKKGLIQESLMPFAAPTPKKDGEWTMCIDSKAIKKIMYISITKDGCHNGLLKW